MMRVDHLVKESFPRAATLEEARRLFANDPDLEQVVIFKGGFFVGILTAADDQKGQGLTTSHKVALGESVPAVIQRMEEVDRPVLPVFDQERFVGLVTLGCLRQFQDDLEQESQGEGGQAETPALIRQIAALTGALENLQAQTQRADQSRAVSCALMRTSLKAMTLAQQMEEALDLIFSVPWLAVESRGVIFLAEPDKTLTMVAQRGLADETVAHCQKLESGYCLCGRAALTGQPVIALSMDEEHEACFAGLPPHGHYCYPILFNDRLLGVLNLYVAVNHVRDPYEEAFLTMTADILAGMIERRRVEDDLRHAKEEAESASLAKTSFLANVSHEIRTPLNAIVGFSRILLKHRSQISPRFLQYLENIRLSGISLTEIINNVLDLAKIEAGKIETDEETVNLQLLIQSFYQVSKDRALEKGVRVSYVLDPNIPQRVRIDRTHTNQVLMNLVENAIKFTPRGREVILRLLREGEEIVFHIEDQGIGIPEDRLEAIFLPFEQADSSTTRRYGGTGLGLAIVKKLVTLMGGTLSVISRLGHGSTFILRLPLKEVPGVEKIAVTVDWHTLRFPPNVKILLVEDNPMNRDMLQAVLADVGLSAKIAENGQQGVEKTLEWRPDLILMDLHMPVMDGLTAVRKIRAQSDLARIPIIGLSADAFVEREKQAMEAGFDHFLTKPVDLDRLMPLIGRYLGLPIVGQQGAGEAQQKETPLPEEIRLRLIAGLKEIAFLPPFESGRIVSLCDALSNLCLPYATPHAEVFHRIRNAVYSRNSQALPDIIQAALDGLKGEENP